jgi:hypothetical protein
VSRVHFANSFHGQFVTRRFCRRHSVFFWFSREDRHLTRCFFSLFRSLDLSLSVTVCVCVCCVCVCVCACVRVSRSLSLSLTLSLPHTHGLSVSSPSFSASCTHAHTHSRTHTQSRAVRSVFLAHDEERNLHVAIFGWARFRKYYYIRVLILLYMCSHTTINAGAASLSLDGRVFESTTVFVLTDTHTHTHTHMQARHHTNGRVRAIYRDGCRKRLARSSY